MPEEVRFDLQRFLSEMRNEMNDGFIEVNATAAKVREDLVAHEMHDIKIAADTAGKLKTLDELRDNVKWSIRAVLGAGIVGGLGVLFDVVKNHWR